MGADIKCNGVFLGGGGAVTVFPLSALTQYKRGAC